MKSAISKDWKNLFEVFEFSELSELLSGTDSQTGSDRTVSRLLQACFWLYFGLAST